MVLPARCGRPVGLLTNVSVMAGWDYAHGDKFAEDHENGDSTDPYGDIPIDDTCGPTTASISIEDGAQFIETLTSGSPRGTILADVSTEYIRSEI